MKLSLAGHMPTGCASHAQSALQTKEQAQGTSKSDPAMPPVMQFVRIVRSAVMATGKAL